ncbi:MAG: cytochrome ubiquinol oxidase subunit I, partial [Rhodobacterales bacterium CG_4_9_14_3_um_filter_71_31]
PWLGSLILTHSLDGEVKGLKAFPKEDRPKSALIFWTFRIMVATGVAMMAVGLWAGVARWRGSLYAAPWLHRAAVAMGPSGFLAVLCGWITTEAGRQPWTVHGLLRTADSASPLDAPAVGASLLAFIVVYFAVFGAGTFYVLRLMGKRPESGPDIDDLGPTRSAGITPWPALKRRPRATPAE